MDHAYKHNTKEKAKARKSGPSVLSKAKELGVLAHTFALAVYWDPTHLCYRTVVHVPEGEIAPDVNSLIADELSGMTIQQSERQSYRATRPRHAGRPQRLLRRSARRRSQQPPQRPSGREIIDPYALTDASVDEASLDSGNESDAAAATGRPISSPIVEAKAKAAPLPGSNDAQEPSSSSQEEFGLISLSQGFAQPSQTCDDSDGQVDDDRMSWGDFNASFATDVVENSIPSSQYSGGGLGLEASAMEFAGFPAQKVMPFITVPTIAWRRAAREALEAWRMFDGPSPRPVLAVPPVPRGSFVLSKDPRLRAFVKASTTRRRCV